MEKKRKK